MCTHNIFSNTINKDMWLEINIGPLHGRQSDEAGIAATPQLQDIQFNPCLNYWLWIRKNNNETKDAPRCEYMSRVPCIVLVFNTPQYRVYSCLVPSVHRMTSRSTVTQDTVYRIMKINIKIKPGDTSQSDCWFMCPINNQSFKKL